ncbi:MAG: ATP-binding cassette domain-containing protein [Opitutae bacterium]|jgi:phosphonate transport system ATP-binding protein|nr:ATP-binding cassette domain-containing protein [Opitutae bacterium]
MNHLETHKLGLSRNGNWLFRNLDLKIPSGSLVAILGPSGVGKSSLLSCLSGSEIQTEGKIEFHFKNGKVRTTENINPELGIIFQSLRLTEHVTVLENVLYGKIAKYGIKQSIFGFPEQDMKHAYQILKDLGIAHLAHKWTSQTSGGEKQRTAIARTLFQSPKIILADEPVSNLDTYYSGRVMGLLRNLANQEGKIIMTALHDPQLVSRFADFALSLNPEDPEGWNLREVRPKV